MAVGLRQSACRRTTWKPSGRSHGTKYIISCIHLTVPDLYCQSGCLFEQEGLAPRLHALLKHKQDRWPFISGCKTRLEPTLPFPATPIQTGYVPTHAGYHRTTKSRDERRWNLRPRAQPVWLAALSPPSLCRQRVKPGGPISFPPGPIRDLVLSILLGAARRPDMTNSGRVSSGQASGARLASRIRAVANVTTPRPIITSQKVAVFAKWRRTSKLHPIPYPGRLCCPCLIECNASP